VFVLFPVKGARILVPKKGRWKLIVLAPFGKFAPIRSLRVLAVSNVLTAPIFSNSRNFETEGDTPEKHGIKSLDP